MEYKVVIGRDEENGVFYIVESDIDGLWLEAATREALIEKIKDAAPNLAEHNMGVTGPFTVRVLVQTLEPLGEPLALA